MNLDIIRKNKSFVIDTKRLYVPYLLKSNCPNCGKEKIKDLEIEYFSYPIIDSEIFIEFMCDNLSCDTWKELIKINLFIEGIEDE